MGLTRVSPAWIATLAQCTCKPWLMLQSTQLSAAEPKTSEKLGAAAEEEGAKVAIKPIPVQQAFFTLVTIGAILLMTITMRGSDTQEISFQWFKTNLLATGLVDKLEVMNKSQVRVYVRPNNAR